MPCRLCCTAPGPTVPGRARMGVLRARLCPPCPCAFPLRLYTHAPGGAPMLGRIRKFIQEYIRDIRISTMSLAEIGELQREADEANTVIVPGTNPGDPEIRLVSLYSTLGTKDSDIDAMLKGEDKGEGEDEDEDRGEGEEKKNDRQV